MDDRYWDERYGAEEQLFSGHPNGALVAEVAGLTPGQALDVGCGEGADALWLAGQGWHVTAVDISRVALERAAALPDGDKVSRVRADLTVAPPPAGVFDLVSVQYYPLPHQPDHAALRRLLAAVAPGGRLLFVSHDLAAFTEHHHHPEIDPADYYGPDEITALLDDGWTIEVDEKRARANPPAADARNVPDVVLRARRDA
ncbi:MAG: methyltransferase domain-containing protein [Streptosporangiales bacterium]|nr:methyltransferase domain-containing protein [Streptosporangiales bacterium]